MAFSNHTVEGSYIISGIINELRYFLLTRKLKPVFHRGIDQNKGIRITGSFSTTYSGIPSPLSYITVGRSPNGVAVHDGLGLAWRTGNISENHYNVYLVDNNILSDDVPIHTNNMIIEDNINNFLAYGKTDIQPNTTYKFGMEIDDTWGMRVCIYSGTFGGNPDFDNPYSESVPSGYIMSMGARLEGHEPQAGGNEFGLSVMGTDGKDWIYDDLKITTIVEGYTASLFKLYANPGNFSSTDPAQLYLVGAGNNGFGVSGMSWYVWNTSGTAAWNYIASNSGATTSQVIYNLDPLNSYLDESNFVSVMAMVNLPSAEGELNIDYVKLSTVPPSGVHIGHMSDIYIHAPSKIVRASVEIAAIGGIVDLMTYVNLPIFEIEEVYYTADPEVPLIRDSSDPATRYIVNNPKPYYTYSMEEDLSLSVPVDANVTVVYTYYSDCADIQSFVESDENRLPTTDVLVKAAPPASITINSLSFRGTISETDARTKIATWINELVRETFEVSDLINYLYLNGVTYVDLSGLDISVILYNVDGSIADSTTISNSYSISLPNTFYTDTLKLAGVTKL